MNKVTPFLWFDSQAHDAARYYVSVFKRAKVAAEITSVSKYPAGAPAPAGSVMTVGFKLGGQDFTALNAGPTFKFTPAVSFVVHCDDQKEVDYFWSRLIADGGVPSQCGWLNDKFGLSWQIVPRVLLKLIADKDRAKAGRVMAAMMQMQKIDIQPLKDAAAGASPPRKLAAAG